MQLLQTLLLSASILTGTPTTGVETPTTPEVVEPTPTTPEEPDKDKLVLEDKNHNGIPDNLEDYYKKNIQDQWMFGISLGALISLGTTLLAWVIKYSKELKTQKLIKTNSEETVSSVKEIKELDKERAETFKAHEEALNNALIEYKAITDTCLTELKEASTKLNQYALVDEKLDACINSISAISKSSDLLAQGITKEVDEYLKEVK